MSFGGNCNWKIEKWPERSRSLRNVVKMKLQCFEAENHFHIFTFSQDENHFHIIAGETVTSGKYKKRAGCVR